jgi:ABC-2 type transport system permease protein
MRQTATRVGAIVIKELTEFRRNRFIVLTAVILPVVFLVSPTATILAAKTALLSSAALQKRAEASLFFPLLIPVFIPSVMSAYSVVGEREQGTLEPVLTTPVSRVELLAGKAAAIFVPTIAIAYLMFGVFLTVVEIGAKPEIASAVLHAPALPAELVFIPLLAAWAIWVGLAVSTRASETRVAQQLTVLASLPPVAVTALLSFGVITPSFALGAAFAAGLLAIDVAACFLVARIFDRERLVTGARTRRTARAAE